MRLSYSKADCKALCRSSVLQVGPVAGLLLLILVLPQRRDPEKKLTDVATKEIPELRYALKVAGLSRVPRSHSPISIHQDPILTYIHAYMHAYCHIWQQHITEHGTFIYEVQAHVIVLFYTTAAT